MGRFWSLRESFMKEVMAYFGYSSAAQFRREWVELSDESKKELIAGVKSGTLTY